MVWVQILGTERCYGGPEEGGWWFDATRVIFAKRAKKRAAKKLAKRLELEVAEMQPRYGRGSVLGGEDVELVVSRRRVEETRRRPSYC